MPPWSAMFKGVRPWAGLGPFGKVGGASRAVYPFPFVAMDFRRRAANPTVPRYI